MTSLRDILEPLQRGKVAPAEAALGEWLAAGPSPADLDLLLLELLDLADAPPYQKDGPARRLRCLLMRIADRHVSADPSLDWAQTRLQHHLGLVESPQTACGVLLSFLKRAPHHLEAHHLYLDTVREHDFFIDLGYEDRVDELRCRDDERAALLLHWAGVEHHGGLGEPDGPARRRLAARVVDLISRARALEPALEWRDVARAVYWTRPEWTSEPDALAQSCCAAELRALRDAVFRD